MIGIRTTEPTSRKLKLLSGAAADRDARRDDVGKKADAEPDIAVHEQDQRRDERFAVSTAESFQAAVFGQSTFGHSFKPLMAGSVSIDWA